MIELFIKQKDYTKYLVDGVPLVDTYTDELDSAIVSVVGVKKMDIDSFDKVRLVINGENHYLMINTYEEQVYSRSPLRYRYNLSLISETKLLERVYLPSLKITKPKNGNTPNYINYFQKIYTLFLFRKKFRYLLTENTELQNALSTSNVIERSWIKSDARSMLNDLFLTIPEHPSIVKVENDVIKLIDLSKKGNPIDLTKGIVESDTVYQTMSDYANSLVSDVVNIVPKKSNLKTFSLPFRNGESGRLEITDNMYIEIPNARIEKIERFEITASASFLFYSESATEKPVPLVIGDTYDFGEGKFKVTDYRHDINLGGWVVEGKAYMDIADSIVEKREYDTYYVLGGMTPSINKKYRIHHLYYIQDDNKIYGLGYKEKLVVSTATALQQVAQRHAPSSLLGVDIHEFSISDTSTVLHGTIKADIYSLNDGRITTYKDDPTNNNISYEDNQSEPYIDLDAFVKQEKERVNRLGNEQRVINITYHNISNIPKLGDYIDDYVLCKREISYVNSQAIAKLTLSKNYYQLNAYYGLQERERFTNLIQDNNTVVRNANREYIVEFSKTNNSTGYEELSKYFARYFTSGESLVPTTLLYSTYDDSNVAIQSNVALQPIVNGAKDITLLTARAKDNFSVGVQVVTTDYIPIQKYVSYVDNNGEYYSHSLTLATGRPELTLSESNKYPELDSSTISKFSQTIPIVTNELYLKDNGEIFNLNMLFRFTATHPNIISLNANIGEYNSLVDDSSRGVIVRYTSNNLGYLTNNSLITIQDNKIHFTNSEFTKMYVMLNNNITFQYEKNINELAKDIYINCIRKE